MNNSINGFRQSLTIGIVGEFNLGVSGFCPVQLLPRTPGEGPPGAVIVAGGIADGIVGNGLATYPYYTSFFSAPQEKKPWNRLIPGQIISSKPINRIHNSQILEN